MRGEFGMESSTIAIIITIITIISFVLEKIPLAMTAMIASLAMGIILPEMKLADVYSGFSSTTVMMVAGMCVVGDALFKTAEYMVIIPQFFRNHNIIYVFINLIPIYAAACYFVSLFPRFALLFWPHLCQIQF